MHRAEDPRADEVGQPVHLIQDGNRCAREVQRFHLDRLSGVLDLIPARFSFSRSVDQ